eukprot:645044_1
MKLQTLNSMADTPWLILGIFSFCFHTLLSIPILVWTIIFVWQHQNETFFKSRKKLLIKIILIFSIFMILILRPIELILGPFLCLIFDDPQIPDFLITWITFTTTTTSSFVVIQLYVLRAWIYFFNIQSVLALQDKLWEKTLYSTNYDNWYLNSSATYGNVKFCSVIISVFSIFFIILLSGIRTVDSHSNGYIAVIVGFECLLFILFIILSIVIANIYSVNDLFALRNELKFDLLTLVLVFIILCCITTVFWNEYQIIWFAFLELTSLIQLIQSVMPIYWYRRVQLKYNKRLNHKRSSNKSKTSVSSKSPKSPDSMGDNVATNACKPTKDTCSTNNHKLKAWWITMTQSKDTQSTEDTEHKSMDQSTTAVDHSKYRKSLRFEDVVCDPRGFREFIKFLSLSFSSENMLFIAEVMRFKNFIFMRDLVSFQDIGYYLDLPSNVIDFMWYIPEEYRNVNHAKRASKRRRSLVLQSKKRRSFSLARLRTSATVSDITKTKSCPASALAYHTDKSELTPEPEDTVSSKHKKRIQWMKQHRNKKKKSNKGSARNTGPTKDDIDLGALSDIEDNDNDLVFIEDDDDDDASISLKDTPQITAMIAPNLLDSLKPKDQTMDDNDEDEPITKAMNGTPQSSRPSSRQSSVRFALDSRQSSVRFPLDLNPSDGNEETTINANDNLKIDDFFDGFNEEEVNEILITPLEDAQRIRDRYIASGAEYQINLSGGIQWQTLQSFSDDPQHIDWKSKMIEVQRKKKNKNTQAPPPALIDVPTGTMTKQSTKMGTASVPKAISIINIIGEKKEETTHTNDMKEEEETYTTMNDIISRFDVACDAIIKQLLLHEFDRFRNTDDYMAYFKSYKKSRKRLGSFYKKIQKKTSHILPSHHHQSPQLRSVNQWSLHKQNSMKLVHTPTLTPTPLQMNKAKSATERCGVMPGYTKKSKSKRNSYTAGQPTRASSLRTYNRPKRNTHSQLQAQANDASPNMSGTYSGVFTLLNNSPGSVSTRAPQTPQTPQMQVMEDIKNAETPTPAMYNKLALIREFDSPAAGRNKNTLKADVITPLDIGGHANIDDSDGYPDLGGDDSKQEEEEAKAESNSELK